MRSQLQVSEETPLQPRWCGGRLPTLKEKGTKCMRASSSVGEGALGWPKLRMDTQVEDRSSLEAEPASPVEVVGDELESDYGEY